MFFCLSHDNPWTLSVGLEGDLSRTKAGLSRAKGDLSRRKGDLRQAKADLSRAKVGSQSG